MRRSRMLQIAVVASVTTLAMAGCSVSGGPDSIADRVERGIPQGWSGGPPDLVDGAPAVGWLDDGRFGVITVGSSSCPAIASSIEASGSAEIRIVFVSSPFETCTADMASTTHVFGLPAGIDERPIAVTLAFGTVEHVRSLE